MTNPRSGKSLIVIKEEWKFLWEMHQTKKKKYNLVGVHFSTSVILLGLNMYRVFIISLGEHIHDCKFEI